MREWKLRLGSREIPISRSLQNGSPQTFIDGGGTRDNHRFQNQDITPEKLRDYKRIRESGGAIASILEMKSLLTFGGGLEYQTENEELHEWLKENIPPSELTLFSIQAGTDAFTYPGVPAEIVTTRGNEFSHLECVEPWTVIPETDKHGDIAGFKQIVQMNGTEKVQRMNEDEIAYLVLIRSNGRDKTGVSLLERNQSEVENYLNTREAVENSVQLHGFPQRQIKVGREGMSPPNDNELRRIRQRFNRAWNELTMFVTGRDVDIETLEATDFDFQGLTEDSLKTLMLAFMLPQEAANVGSDGLGSGMPAKLRKNLLKAETNARQNDFAGQLQRQLIGPVIDEYSPFSSDELDRIEYLGPELEDDSKDELDRLQQKIKIGQEAADAGLEATFEGEDVQIESGDFEQQEQGGMPGEGGGLFGSEPSGTDFRSLQIPDNAVPIDSPAEAPEGASIVEGDRGGLYYVPAGENTTETVTENGESPTADEVGNSVESRDEFTDEGLESALEDAFFRDEIADNTEEYLSENTDLQSVTVESVDRIDESAEHDFKQTAERVANEVLRLNEAGHLENIEQINFNSDFESEDTPPNGTVGFYSHEPSGSDSPVDDHTLSLNGKLIDQAVDDGREGESPENVISHETGHAVQWQGLEEGAFDEDRMQRDLTAREKTLVENELGGLAGMHRQEFFAEAYRTKVDDESELSETTEGLFEYYLGSREQPPEVPDELIRDV